MIIILLTESERRAQATPRMKKNKELLWVFRKGLHRQITWMLSRTSSLNSITISHSWSTISDHRSDRARHSPNSRRLLENLDLKTTMGIGTPNNRNKRGRETSWNKIFRILYPPRNKYQRRKVNWPTRTPSQSSHFLAILWQRAKVTTQSLSSSKCRCTSNYLHRKSVCSARFWKASTQKESLQVVQWIVTCRYLVRQTSWAPVMDLDRQALSFKLNLQE